MKNYILYLKLLDSKLSRTISLPEELDFYDLHHIIQIIFGWEDYHMYEFQVNKKPIVPADNEDACDIYGNDFKYADDVNLDLILNNVKYFKYTYDFGDNWEIDITVRNIVENGLDYPKLIKSSGTMAMEDCGGTDGLREQHCDGVDIDEINEVLEEEFPY